MDVRFQNISASSNPKYKTWISLLKSQGIRESGLFLLYGKPIAEVLEQNPEKVNAILFTAEHMDQVRAYDATLLKTKKATHFELSKELFKELDVFGIHQPIFVCESTEIPQSKLSSPQGLELLLALQNPSNLGAILRSALNFDVSKIIILKECSHPYHPKSIRALSSNPYLLNFEMGPALSEIKASDKNFFALDANGKSLKDHKWPKNCFLLLGEEGQGLPSSIPEQAKLSIASSGKIDSLNATVAASIALYDYFHQ
ncbi:MAG: TrmH family RNA methyltransferase [Bdellovibrionales bacterium]